jgi:hypothetical protein
VSVDHHRFVPPKSRRGVAGETTQRETDGAGDMRIGELSLREDVDDLGVLFLDESL